ncbi:MAG TPA: SWIM zinc finger family protein [Candidatus Thermoplasmatota archaeon]|nr:SWIM zinc finger family protein [Candidatus Thermoplasmatota archaeon]
MIQEIYEKGRRLCDEGKVALDAETDRAAYFAVTGDSGVHHVRLMRDNTFNCTCLWGSLKGAVYGALCSHVVAVVLARSLGREAPPEASPEAANA